MRCTTCDAELVDGKRFCPACGASASLRCRACGAELQPEFRFCPDCGVAVGSDGVHDAVPPPAPEDPFARLSRGIPETLAQKVRAARGAIEGERKQVTVLFCDLAGSTAIAERMDPEEYHDLLEEYLALAFREIYHFDGIVNQLAGDGMMALFGAPVAHEDAPQRAVRAALRIHEALAELNDRLRAARGIELRARIGIHTGPVVVGTVGNDLKMDYTAIGDTTNAASRLESLAGPGGILISEATYRLVRGFFDVRPAGTLEVKGRTEPVVAFEVLGHAASATPMTIAVARGLTPFVGRREELNLLKACYRRLSGTGAQVVAVVGEAGSGKSRLLYEFRRRLTLEGTVFFEGRCSSMSQSAPYHPFLGMFRQYFDLVPNEPASVSCDKVSRKVGVEYDHIEREYPLLCRFLSLRAGSGDLPTAELKQESFDALARLVLKETERTPVVMVIEDLHWIDEPSRELLENLVARLAHAKVLVVVSERPDGAQPWRARGTFTQLVLPRLADDDVAGVIRAVAGGPLPRTLEARLVEKAEGSPFFAEEMTRGLLEAGYLVRENGGSRLTRPVEEISVPGTVQEVLAARLDRLDPAAKHVVQVASVLGRQFVKGQLVALLAEEDVDVGRALDEIEQRGLVHRKSALSEDEYRFGESLTQEVAYEGLLHKQRRQLHERIGLLLEQTPGDGAERSALLAHHFARSDNRPKTIEALLRAAVDAERLPSYSTAVAFYRQAWDLIAAGAGADDIEPELRAAAVQAGTGYARLSSVFGAADPGNVERAAATAAKVAETLGDREAMASLAYQHGVIMMLGEPERYAEGLARAEQGLAIAQEAKLTLPALRLSQGLAINYAFDGRSELAQRAVGWVLEEVTRAGGAEPPSDLYLGARWIRDNVLLMADQLDAAIEAATETHAMALRAPNRTVRYGSASVLAHVHFLRGQYPDALRWADESLEIAEAIASLGALPGVAAIALTARVELGERVQAERYLDAIERGLGAGENLLTNIRFIGDAYVALGDQARIEHHVELLQGMRGCGRLREAFLAVSLGTLLARLERYEEGARAFARALGLADAVGARSTLAAAALGAAEIADGRGEEREARRLRERGVEIATGLGLQRYLNRYAPAAGGRPAAAV